MSRETVLAGADRLPPGAAIVYRAFGEAGADAFGRRLRKIADRRRLALLVGADAALARRIGADGVHLPERDAARAGPLKRSRAGWLVTVAAHNPRSLRRARAAGADAAVLSAVFPSRSPSAGKPLGVLRLALTVRRTGAAVYALGGVSPRTAARLRGTGVVGFAAVEGWAAEAGIRT